MLQTVVAISMLFFLFMYSVGQLKAGASVWYALTGLSPLWCLLLSIFVAWLYMAMGGYVGNQYAMALQGLVFAIVGFPHWRRGHRAERRFLRNHS